MSAQAGVPATVRSAEADGSWSVLLDDGTLELVGADAVADGGFRLLRSGQRVRLHRDGSGVVVSVTLP